MQAGGCFPTGAAVSGVRAAPGDGGLSPLRSAASLETCFCSRSSADLGSSPNFPNNRENRLVFLHLQTSMLVSCSPKSSRSHARLWGRLHRARSVKAPRVPTDGPAQRMPAPTGLPGRGHRPTGGCSIPSKLHRENILTPGMGLDHSHSAHRSPLTSRRGSGGGTAGAGSDPHTGAAPPQHCWWYQHRASSTSITLAVPASLRRYQHHPGGTSIAPAAPAPPRWYQHHPGGTNIPPVVPTPPRQHRHRPGGLATPGSRSPPVHQTPSHEHGAQPAPPPRQTFLQLHRAAPDGRGRTGGTSGRCGRGAPGAGLSSCPDRGSPPARTGGSGCPRRLCRGAAGGSGLRLRLRPPPPPLAPPRSAGPRRSRRIPLLRPPTARPGRPRAAPGARRAGGGEGGGGRAARRGAEPPGRDVPRWEGAGMRRCGDVLCGAPRAPGGTRFPTESYFCR